MKADINTPTKEDLIPEKINLEIQNQNISPEKKNNKIDYYLRNKEKKLNELLNFDVMPHFKSNIIHSNNNCKHSIDENSYYCINCKKSVCNKCGLLEHNDHILIHRENYFEYDELLFYNLANAIEEGINLDIKKEPIKISINKSFEFLKNELEILKKLKLNEIDDIFKKIKSNYLELNNNYIKCKDSLENYYKINKKFFNINIDNINNNNSNKNNNESNKDLENTIFLMNFEIMNLYENKDMEIINLTNNLKINLSNITNIIDKKTLELSNLFNTFFNFDLVINKFDNFFCDIQIRTQKYNEYIDSFKDTILNILKKNGNFEKLKDLISLFDAKNKKGKDVLFNQEYFLKNDMEKEIKGLLYHKKANDHFIDNSNYLIKKRLKSNYKNTILRNNKLIINHSINTRNKSLNEKKNKSFNYKKNTSQNLKKVTSPQKKSYNINEYNISMKNDNIFMTYYNYNNLNTNFINNNNLSFISYQRNDVILNKRYIQRFFAYSIYDFYSKHFKIKEKELLLSENSELKSISNIEINNSNSKNIKIKQQYNNNNKILESLLPYYTERFYKTKEKAKPIPNTNTIQLFDLSTNKIVKVQIKLNKDIHGYTLFPDGCRHILIEQILYIIGGTNKYGKPLNIVLSFNIINNHLVRLPNLKDNHSYHTVEYLDNFDCIIVIGGENTSSCELMDIDTKEWIRLPSLIFPRANSNIYNNNLTNEIFVLFGIEGKMSGKHKYIDTIEVLEINNISKGWNKLDYYKSNGLDFKEKYCITLPFNRDKLLIYGCSGIKNVDKKIYALFDMIKNQCIKVDQETMIFLRNEEKRIKSFVIALSKFS